MLGLDSVAYIAACHIICDVFAHSGPPKCSLQIPVHLGAAGVDGISGLMCFSQYLLPPISLVWYTYSVFKPLHSLGILVKRFGLATRNSFLDFSNFRVLSLRSFNILHQG